MNLDRPKAWAHTSPSQIKTFRSCQRKWWFEKIAGLPSPGTAATALGTRVHAVIEAYLKGGKAPDGTTLEGAIALPGLRLLPRPEQVVPAMLERPMLLHLDGAAVPIKGVLDMVEPRAEPPMVTDHKTTSNFRYMKEEEELRADPQCVAYLAELRALLRKLNIGAPTLAFRHVYYLTDKRRKPEARQSRVTLSTSELDDGCGRLCGTIDKQAAVAVVTSAKDVQPNLAACGDYGGCPFQVHCARLGDNSLGPLSALVRPRSTQAAPSALSQEPAMSDFAARVAARKTEQAKAQGAPAAPVAATPITTPAVAAQVATPAASTTADLRAKAQAAVATAESEALDAPLTPDQKPTPEALDKMKAMGTGEAPFQPENGINPPDGFPKDEPGVLEKSAEREPAAVLPDGRKLSDLKKGEVVEARAALLSTIRSLGKGDVYDGATAIQADQVKVDRQTLDADVKLLLRILGGKAPKALPAAEPTPAAADPKPMPQLAVAGPDAAERAYLGGLADVKLAFGVVAVAAAEVDKADILRNEAHAKLVDIRQRIGQGDEAAEDELPAARKAEKEAQASYDKALELSLAEHQTLTRIEQAALQAFRTQPAHGKPPLHGGDFEEVRPRPSPTRGTRKEFYINSYPRVRPGEPPVVFLEHFMEPFMQKVAEANGVQHYLYIDFNRGPKLVAAAIAYAVGQGEVELPARMVALRRVMGDPVAEALALLYGERGDLVVEPAG